MHSRRSAQHFSFLGMGRKDLPIVIDYIMNGRRSTSRGMKIKELEAIFFLPVHFVPIHLYVYCLFMCCHLRTIECRNQAIWMAMNENVQLVLYLAFAHFFLSCRSVGRLVGWMDDLVHSIFIHSFKCHNFHSIFYYICIFNQKSERRMKENLHLLNFFILYSFFCLRPRDMILFTNATTHNTPSSFFVCVPN